MLLVAQGKEELFSRFATSTLVSLSAQNLTTSNCRACRKNKNHSANSSLLPAPQSSTFFRSVPKKSNFSTHDFAGHFFFIYINICIRKFLYLSNLCWIQFKRIKFCFSLEICPNVWHDGEECFRTWYGLYFVILKVLNKF